MGPLDPEISLLKGLLKYF